MPNDCWNYITIESHDNPKQLHDLIENEFANSKIDIKKKGPRGIILLLLSKWTPDFDWLQNLVTRYPDCWIKNEWSEEGGTSGVWVGGRLFKDKRSVIKTLEWDDICIEGSSVYFDN
jgi:hypothetical protein